MVIKIYGMPRSTSSKRIVMVCKEKQVPYELVAVKMLENEHKTSEFIEKQPFGQIPYMLDEEENFILYESRAICRYICLKHPSQGIQLIPTDLKSIALFEQAASVELSNFEAIVSPLFHEKVLRPQFRGIPSDPKRIDGYWEELHSRLIGYERILSKHKYLAGDDLTLADTFHLPYLDKTHEMDDTVLPSYPSIWKWYQDIASRPSWQEIKHTVPQFG